MAVKIFEVKKQGHACFEEQREFRDNRHGDIIRCSCGKYFMWKSEQRESWWKEVTREEAVAIITNLNSTLTREEVMALVDNPT